MTHQNNCPFCQSENVTTLTETFSGLNRADELIEIKDYEYTECLDCQQDFITGEQAKRNEEKIAPLAQW